MGKGETYKYFVEKLSILIIWYYLCQMKTQTLIIEYADIAIEELITYHKSDDKRYKKLKSNATFLHDLDGVMAILRAVTNTSELSWHKKLNYEPLKYGLSGYSSVRIGFTSKYRLIFEEFDGGIRIKLIEINEHYGDK